MNFERGSTSLGSGSVAGFAYINKGGFDSDYFTEIYLNLNKHYMLYSDEYNDFIETTEDKVQAAVDKREMCIRDSLCAGSKHQHRLRLL